MAAKLSCMAVPKRASQRPPSVIKPSAAFACMEDREVDILNRMPGKKGDTIIQVVASVLIASIRYIRFVKCV